jgi:hypothetical protein
VIQSPFPLSCPRAHGKPDVILREGRASRFARARLALDLSSTARDWFECRRLPAGTTYLRWAGLFEFLIARDGRRIEFRRLRGSTGESLATYLLGQVLSFSMLSFGYEPLHATAVAIDGEAIGFLGNCGYGKSTLGAAFLARGCAILTDDVLAVEPAANRWIAHAGPARLKLFPTVALRVLSRDNGRLMNPDTSKLVLPLAAEEAVAGPLPLTALYVLNDPADQNIDGVAITPLGGQQAFIEAVGAAFNLIRIDRPRLENHFGVVTRLVREVPMRRLSYSRTFASLDAVCAGVLNDVAAIRKARSTLRAASQSRPRPPRRTRPTRAHQMSRPRRAARPAST